LAQPPDTIDFGDGTPFLGNLAHLDCFLGFGPWTTPAAEPVHAELDYDHAYASPGTFTVRFTYKTLGNCAYPPDQVTVTLEVAVTAT
ncbi:MAG TPA: hypothetical protein VFO65_07180, partial [Acidimicrobiales bacterium]|nr:hypothetical protein [Acidimicrobiales bacterium]